MKKKEIEKKVKEIEEVDDKIKEYYVVNNDDLRK